MKKISSALLKAFCAVLLFAGGVLLYFRYETSALDRKDSTGELVKIKAGMTPKEAGKLLKEKHLIRNAKMFYAAARYPAFGKIAGCAPLALEYGVYRVKGSMSTAEIFALLSSGKTESIRVTIPEGLTIKKTAARLEDAGVCSAKDFINVCYEKKTSPSLYGTTLEGYLFPDTYFFEPEITAEEVASAMVENFKAHLETISAFGNMSGEEMYRALILASIVEREYRAADEAPLIAGVFMNRMNAGIGLYSCATVEYIITEIEGRPHPDVIKYDDLKNDNPYNTYKWASLPPTPISNPGMVSLNAAANPAATDCYYFRLADAENGRHVFTKTLSSHAHEGEIYRTKATE